MGVFPLKNLTIPHVYGSSGVASSFLIVGDHKNGLAKALIEPTQELQDCRRILAVQTTGGSICEQNRGLVDKSARYGHPLLLAARQCTRLMLHPIRNSQNVEDLKKQIGRASCRERV